MGGLFNLFIAFQNSNGVLGNVLPKARTVQDGWRSLALEKRGQSKLMETAIYWEESELTLHPRTRLHRRGEGPQGTGRSCLNETTMYLAPPKAKALC